MRLSDLSSDVCSSDLMRDEIRERICLLTYPPGTRLSEAALAAEFGVSRTPIRRVLAHLEAGGLVESRHGVGTVVTTIDLPRLREIYALRMRLAELIGELAPRRSEEHTSELQSLMRISYAVFCLKKKKQN